MPRPHPPRPDSSGIPDPRRERQMLDQILDNIPLSVFWKDREGRYLGCNAAFARAIGLDDPRRIAGLTDHDLPWPREETEAYLAADREIMATGEARLHILEPLQQADGSRLWIDSSKVPLRDGEGRVVGVLGIFRDVTERRRTEEALQETQRMLRLVLDTIPARVFWKDRESRYLGCNRIFAQDAGLSDPAEIVGHTDDELGWRDQADLYRTDDRRVVESGEPKLGYEEPQTTPDGSTIWLRTSKIPLRDAEDSIIGVMGTYEDITERKQAEQERLRLETQIQHAQKLESLGILAGGIAHDFNNLLVAILGHADLALGDMSAAAPGRESIDEIRRAAIRASELTNQMLAYSGKGRFVVRRLQLNDVVSEMSHLLEAAISKKISLRHDLGRGLPPVEVDISQIRQVVMNLVTNAAEAIGDRAGLITLTTGVMEASGDYLASTYVDDDLPAGAYVYVEVSDNGCGMDDEALTRLFDPFFTTKFSGRGLGLAAVLGIVRGHRGTIKVYSEEGRGTTIKILLPAAPGEVAAIESEPADAPGVRGGGGVILVIDDEFAVRDIASRMLTRQGFEILTAPDGRSGLEIFRQHRARIRAVLLDMTMPRMDGVETFRELRRIDPDIRVVLTSGYNEQDATNRFVGKGLAGFIQKPFTLQQLMVALGKALE